MTKIYKFRDNGESEIINRSRDLLGLNNDSAVIRILLNMGFDRLNGLFINVLNVARPLKYSEIDYLTTSLNVYLKDLKRSSDPLISKKLATNGPYTTNKKGHIPSGGPFSID